MADRRLLVPVDQVIDVHPDETSVQRTWRGVQRLRAERRARREQRWMAPAAAAAILVIGFVGWQVALELGASSDAGPLRLANGAAVGTLIAPASPGARVVRFSDGSSARLEPGSRLEPIANGPDRFSVRLARGAATVEVRPGGPRRWTVEAGLAQIEVVGTRFGVERTESSVRVTVSRGAVLVRAASVPDGVRRLEAGEHLTVRPRRQPDPPGDPSPIDPEPGSGLDQARRGQAAVGGRTAASATRTPTAAAARPRQWLTYAREGAYDEAYAALGSDGVEGASARASADELLALADVARLSGHPAEAIAPLERLLAERASDSRAPLAAFTLGRVYMDDLGQPRAASEAFERALSLGLPRDLVGAALARRALCLERAGDREGARLAASAYLSRFPDGDRSRAMRELAGGR